MRANSASVSREDRIKRSVAKENAAWDQATEQRADAEYLLEIFEDLVAAKGLASMGLSEEAFEERRATMQETIRDAKRKEEAARRAWQSAVERAEKELGQ